MYIQLGTGDVWEITGDFKPGKLFEALPVVCVPEDILIIGSYWVKEEVGQSLRTIEIELPDDERPFSSSFDLNMSEYPTGRFYAFNPGHTQIETLMQLSQVPQGGVEKDIFFDHLLLYRRGIPLVPLIYFHDAFMGGTLYLSGHYSEKTIQSFIGCLRGQALLVDNPDLRIESRSIG